MKQLLVKNEKLNNNQINPYLLQLLDDIYVQKLCLRERLELALKKIASLNNDMCCLI